MGIIARQFRKGQTARLLAPVYVVVELNEDQVLGIAQRLVDTFAPDKGLAAFVLGTGYGYWLEAKDECTCLVTCGAPQPGDGSRCCYLSWEARIQVSRPSELNDTEAMVELRLTRWRETRDKEVVRKDAYTAFRDQFFTELQSTSPRFAQVTA